MKSFFVENFRWTFAGAIFELLVEPRSVGAQPSVWDTQTSPWGAVTFVMVRGKLPLKEHGENGSTSVDLTVHIFRDWHKRLPIVTTTAKFLRREVDWHVPQGNTLCFGLDEEWELWVDRLWDSGLDTDQIISTLSRWCIRNVDSLITRHLIGHRHRLVKWPKEWTAWAHGKQGVNQFYRDNQSRARG